jgi:hypothetical protein
MTPSEESLVVPAHWRSAARSAAAANLLPIPAHLEFGQKFCGELRPPSHV